MSRIRRSTLRSVLGKADLDALVSERERLNEDLQQIIDEQTEPWGIKVTTVEIKDVVTPSTMQRAMVRQAEAELERRAKIIHAEGEHQASARLSQAAAILSQTAAAMQLRYLQTLSGFGGERGSTIVFPLPLDLIRPLLETTGSAPAGDDDPAALAPGPRDDALAGMLPAGDSTPASTAHSGPPPKPWRP
jgi:regulator of protease activity HflC (stomatin/prohibitin superfamily)